MHYNNRIMRIIETDNVLDAINKFFEERRKHLNNEEKEE